MKYALAIVPIFFYFFSCCQTPIKYSVLIGSDYIQVDPDGNLDTIALERPPKEYEAVITWNGAGLPSVAVKTNELPQGAISWAYTTTGTLTGTLSGAFGTGLTYGFAQQQGRGSSPRVYRVYNPDANTVILYGMNSSLALTDPSEAQEIYVKLSVYYQ